MPTGIKKQGNQRHNKKEINLWEADQVPVSNKKKETERLGHVIVLHPWGS